MFTFVALMLLAFGASLSAAWQENNLSFGLGFGLGFTLLVSIGLKLVKIETVDGLAGFAAIALMGVAGTTTWLAIRRTRELNSE